MDFIFNFYSSKKLLAYSKHASVAIYMGNFSQAMEFMYCLS